MNFEPYLRYRRNTTAVGIYEFRCNGKECIERVRAEIKEEGTLQRYVRNIERMGSDLAEI
jgi:hypothetical protein